MAKKVATALGGVEDSEVIIEQADDDAPLDVAPDRRRVKTDKSDLPVETLHGWVTRGKINPQPESSGTSSGTTSRRAA